ncbi:hypothetical protein BDB00DRAFT_835550 [Zychaea mexicana]|uniref:uncharacterized protein n=1 Tax=Zychaea mexicana TaxID=64656 RepID=UPI0022FE5A62|nr:uncharacterized protein BDB00DRAFT_835550 [Zychaea mexicana]KAI9490992.1 hypothetical protein BDB00DRAFT_835550 [Zychaea mexicana]
MEKDHIDEIVVEPDTGEWGYRLEDIDDSDVDDDDGDLITEQHITVYNKAAITRIRDDLVIEDVSPFECLSVTTKEPVKIRDVFDDLTREQAFYDQALEAARTVKKQAEEHDAPFLPPSTDDSVTLKAARQTRNVAAAKKSLKKIKTDQEMEHTEQLVDKAKLFSRKRKDKSSGLEGFTLDDDFDMDMDDLDDDQQPSKKKWKANSPNMKLNRRMNSNNGKKPLSAMKSKKKASGRPGKARRHAQRTRR